MSITFKNLTQERFFQNMNKTQNLNFSNTNYMDLQIFLRHRFVNVMNFYSFIEAVAAAKTLILRNYCRQNPSPGGIYLLTILGKITFEVLRSHYLDQLMKTAL